MSRDFREFLHELSDPKLADVRPYDAYGYFEHLKEGPRISANVQARMKILNESEFEGVTTDGTLIDNLFPLGADEQAPTAAAADAARSLLDVLDAEQRANVTHPLDSKVWRAWLNPEYHMCQFGLRLEELEPRPRQRALDLVAASLSPEGFTRVRDAMRTNAFLGELTDLPKIMNEFSYNINVFGEPSETEPWGWNLWGHHVCVNCAFVGAQQVVTPVFVGAEPSLIDVGANAGVDIFKDQEAAALAVVNSLPEPLRRRAVLYDDKRDDDLPPGRRHPADDLHLAGAFQDNRVISLEGAPVREFPDDAKRALLAFVEHFFAMQPAGPRAARLADVRRHLDDSWFCWIGGTGPDDVFYTRVQSPVVIAEFEHHNGVFLANREPQKFHVHTVLRTPNGNDYASALIRQKTGEARRLTGSV